MKQWLRWALRAISSVILLQTLFFKFTAAPEAVAIFTVLGVEPWGRITVGIIELFLAIALLIPSIQKYSSLAVAGLMIGALAAHVFVLGVAGEMMSLFILALIVSGCSITLYQNAISEEYTQKA